MDHDEWQDGQETVRVAAGDHAFDVAYREFGDPDERPTLFLHGIPTWGFLFREVVEAAPHAVVPDLPGYGYTRHRGPGGYDRSVRAQEAYVSAFLDALGYDSVGVVGHDIGGSTALRLAVRSDRVDRLVLSNAGTFDSWPYAPVAEWGFPDRARTATYAEVAEWLRDTFAGGLYDGARATDEFLDGMVAPFMERPVTDLSRNAVALNTNHTLELVGRHDEVEAPTLLLWGRPGSGQHVGYADRLAEAVPDVERRYVDGSGHWVLQDRPDAYRAELAAFL
jgi:pimeloyl-ACP methyl ester carboxylesterase